MVTIGNKLWLLCSNMGNIIHCNISHIPSETDRNRVLGLCIILIIQNKSFVQLSGNVFHSLYRRNYSQYTLNSMVSLGYSVYSVVCIVYSVYSAICLLYSYIELYTCVILAMYFWLYWQVLPCMVIVGCYVIIWKQVILPNLSSTPQTRPVPSPVTCPYMHIKLFPFTILNFEIFNFVQD